MRYSVWSSYYMELSPEAMVDAFLEAGFSCTELSDEHGFMLLERGTAEKVGREFRAYADARGFSFPQGHLWLRANLCDGQKTVDILKNWLDLFLAMGIRAAVLHPGSIPGADAGQVAQVRHQALTQLCSHLQGTDMSICLENLPGSDIPMSAGLVETVRAVGSSHLGICLDTGHLNFTADKESPSAFIRRCGPLLQALHIADNEGASDQHMMPYGRGNVDWEDVIRGLAEIGYQGLFNLEVPGERLCPAPVKRAKLDYLKAMCTYMVGRIQG